MIARVVATVGGVGNLPGAPGTWGSLAAIPLTVGLHWIGEAPFVVGVTILLFALGWWSASRHPGSDGGDPSEIVIDEVVGQMIALWPLSIGLWLSDAPSNVFPWPGWVGGFLMFRFFDIVKPPPVSWVDRPGALWIMLDDVVAGALAAAVVLLAAGIAHG
ncbi:MAG: phosphatidylglycerophosphatase A [Pseudomonadota bacterium]